MIVKELEVPTPWGHVAARTWGHEDDTPVLVVHGMCDNAGSFDRLIPCLPPTFYYICIDLPGHGRSSHLPPHLPLNPVNYILVYKIVTDYFKKTKYILLGHSWGARMSIFFAQLYPGRVEKLVLLDAVYLHWLPADQFKDFHTNQFDQIVETNAKLEKNSAPSYSYEEALERVLKGRVFGNELCNEGAQALLKRYLIPVGDGRFHFSMDIRLKTSVLSIMYDRQFIIQLLHLYPIKCPVLFVVCSDSLKRYTYYKPFVRIIKKHNPKCFVKVIKGNHDIHINHPQVVAALVNSFLLSKNSKL